MDSKFYEMFGADFDLVNYVNECMNSNITLPDALHRDYNEMYPDSDAQVDFDKLGNEMNDEWEKTKPTGNSWSPLNFGNACFDNEQARLAEADPTRRM
jgi:hypothetical protein